jgi:hypothetical protein
METAGMFNGHSEYFKVIWYILWPFGNVVVIWYIFPHFWYIASRKIWQPGEMAAFVSLKKRILRK